MQFSPNPLKNDTYPVLDRILCDEFQRNFAFLSVKNDMELIGGPSFLTEFGVCAFGMGNGTYNTDECAYILDAADNYMESWTYWDSDFYDGNYQINYQLVDLFSRVYPMSTAGIPSGFFYNTTTKIFIYQYTVDPTIQQPTEIFIPEYAYPDHSFQVSASNHLQWSYDKDESVVSITLEAGWTQPFLAKVMIMPIKIKFPL